MGATGILRIFGYVALLVACGDSPIGPTLGPDGGLTPRDASTADAAPDNVQDASVGDGGTARIADGGPGSGVSFASYRIDVGAHTAVVIGGKPGNPNAGLATLSGRDFDLAFDSSARYVITSPVQPNDQLDWNKLPGFSDCQQLDLAVHGAMFGWRWRIDRNPKVLEVTAYANADSKHAAKLPVMLELSEAELALDAPLHYRVGIDGGLYRFSIAGSMGGRTIAAETTLPRGCPNASGMSLKWTSGLYFGGTSTAPSVITARVFERAW